MTDQTQMEAVVEAILFVTKDPVSRAKLLEVFDEKEREAASAALDTVIDRYREDAGRGIMVDEVAGGLRLVSRPDLHGYLRRFFEVTGSNKLSMPALESLAIVAYRQPVTAPEIQELRGVNSSGVLKKLLERHLIRIAGRKEVVGKPFLYGTTREFLQHFGLKNLKELPPLEQFEELFGGDVIAAPEQVEPDPEEDAEREVAEMEEQQDEALDRAESDAIEDERMAAEQAEQFAQATDPVEDVVVETDEGEDGEPEDEAVADEVTEDEAAVEEVAEGEVAEEHEETAVETEAPAVEADPVDELEQPEQEVEA